MNERLIYIGLSGLAGSGKTTTADLLAPSVGQFYHDPALAKPEIFTHFTLAAPIYDMVGIMRGTEGDGKKDRILHQLHEIIYSLIGSRLSYNEFYDLVNDVATWPVGTSFDAKPRKFMQDIGDLLRSVYEDCFVSHMINKVYRDTAAVDDDYYAMGAEPPIHYAVISDIRYANEMEKLRDSAQVIMVKLDVSFDIANQRILDRDDVAMTKEQWDHPTEAGFPDDEFDLIINTDELTKAEVVAEIKKFLEPNEQEILLSVEAAAS